MTLELLFFLALTLILGLIITQLSQKLPGKWIYFGSMIRLLYNVMMLFAAFYIFRNILAILLTALVLLVLQGINIFRLYRYGKMQAKGKE